MSFGLIASAVGAGLLSFFSPCVLPVLPVYLGALCQPSQDGKASLASRLGNTLAFVLGICSIFVMLGVGVSLLGSVANNPYLTIALGLVVVAFGLELAGFIRIPLLEREYRAKLGSIEARGLLGSFLLGLAFSFGWTPCVGPVLGTILALAAQQGSMLVGMVLLLVYSLGFCVPFMLIALVSDAALVRLRRLGPWLPKIQRVGGVLIVLMGLWMVFNQVSVLTALSRVSSDEAAYESAETTQDNSRLIADANGAHAGDLELNGISSAWKNVILTDLDGSQHRLSELSGKPVYFEFWGSWCESCVQDLGQLTEVWRERERAGDVTVVSVVVPGLYGERDIDDFVAWAAENDVELPVYMDTNGSLSTYLNVVAFPTSVFVGSDGSLSKIRAGAIERTELDELLDQLE